MQQHVNTIDMKISLKQSAKPGAVAHNCNPSTLGGRGGQIMDQRSRPFWPTCVVPVAASIITVLLPETLGQPLSSMVERETGAAATGTADGPTPIHPRNEKEQRTERRSPVSLGNPRQEHFRRPRWVNHLRSGVRDQPGQYGETPSLLKIQKLARHGGKPLRLRQENHLNPGGEGCGEPRSHHCTPAWLQSKTPSQKKKKIMWNNS
ncbi:hypothetical protein AAY473_000324 [Plecturocebus cupreus]